MSNRAWVTLATNDSYGLGALVLAHSLRRANTAYPAVVLITPSVTEAMRNRLSAVFAEVITVNVLDSQDAAHLALLQRPELGITFTKIHCWTLTQYQKCVFLDADTLIIQNCDELFEREELSAAPDVGWPDCFNSGVFVFVPSEETYSRLITFAQERGSFDGGDQGLLNAFFADWAYGDINKHLPFLYNVTSAAFYSYIPALKHYGQDLKIIHFIGAAKPWLQQYNWQSHSVDAPEHLRQFLQLWWDLFVGQVHSQLDIAMESAVNEEQGPLEPSPESPPEDNQHHYEPKITADSEFPWHWPEASSQEAENQVHHVNMSEIHDPWEHCRGNIPPREEYSSQHSDFGGFCNEKEIRKYAWEYQESYDRNVWQQTQQQEYNNHQHHDHHFHHQDSHTHQHDSHYEHHEHHPQHRNQQHQNENPYSQHEHADHYTQNNFKENIHNYLPEDYHQHSVEHEPYHSQRNQSQHEHSNNSFHSHQYKQFNDHSNNSHHKSDQSCSQESHKHQIDNNQQRYRQDHGAHNPTSHIVSSDNNNRNKHFVPYLNQINEGQVYHVHSDHHRQSRRNRQHRRLNFAHQVCVNGILNGHVSDSESEEEYIIPRHPYDGFYLRHIPTIDPRGRKICIHEIPPTPIHTPSPSEEHSSRESSFSSEEYSTASECEDQYSGVAGNLARVVPGTSSYESEAIDELTRRQGWEAGNIDYMGADSFDNIWAKISQTLSQQPPKQPSPPRKEPTPPKEPSPLEQPQPEAVPKPVEQSAPTPAPAAVPEAAPAPTSVPVSAPATAAAPAPKAPKTEAPAPAPTPTELPKPVEKAIATEVPKVQPIEKTEPTVPPTPPATPKSTPEASSPVTETAPEPPKVTSPAPAVAPPATPTKLAATPEKPQDSSVTTTASTDSPPLANTPSKEEVPAISPAKCGNVGIVAEERRKPVEKLQLSPPALADALPTPDSELEDAAALAHAIITSELSTSVTASTPAADATPPPPLEEKRLSVEAPELPTPPVSLAQIGVKPKGKPSTAAQIESSVSEKVEPATPAAPASTKPEFPVSPAPAASEVSAPATPTSPTTPAPPSEAGKKKVVKKGVKKEAGPSGDTPTPVPPPRKKEKKPKEK